jgi:hypothetical protein
MEGTMRKKLRLTLDALTVESFVAVAETEERGTVAGYVTSPDEGCTGPDTACTGLNDTCYETCLKSCGGTCKWQTCNAPWACP